MKQESLSSRILGRFPVGGCLQIAVRAGWDRLLREHNARHHVRRSENLPSCVYPVHLAFSDSILSLILFFLILFLYLSLTLGVSIVIPAELTWLSDWAIHRSINTNSSHIHKQVLFTGQHQSSHTHKQVQGIYQSSLLSFIHSPLEGPTSRNIMV